MLWSCLCLDGVEVGQVTQVLMTPTPIYISTVHKYYSNITGDNKMQKMQFISQVISSYFSWSWSQEIFSQSPQP